MAYLTTIVALVIGLTSAYSLYFSQLSIPKLQRYESKSEKAAEWSKTAEKQLWDTRFTVGAGVVAAAISLLGAVWCILFVPGGFSVRRVIWAAIITVGETFTSRYMASFWGSKASVPFMQEYNDAVAESKNVAKLHDFLALGWAVMAVLRVVGL